MNDDDRLLLEVRSWLQDEDVVLPDAEQAGRLVAAELPHTRQRRRKWWPLPNLGRVSAPPTTNQTTDFQPDAIPATNGHTPTITGRTQIMFSPAKAIAAAALVFGIGSVVFIAQPSGQGDGVPLGATTDDAQQPPVEFTGTWCVGPEVAPDRAGTETTLEVGDERMTLRRYRLGAWRNTVTMSDPRLQGDAYQTYENDRYARVRPERGRGHPEHRQRGRCLGVDGLRSDARGRHGLGERPGGPRRRGRL